MPELSCTECTELAPELALNALTGRERAKALAHLDRCRRCRKTVSALTTTADELLGLLPGAEPPPGFEKRVLASLDPAGAPRRPTAHSHRWPTTAAASTLALMLISAGFLLGSSVPTSVPPDQSSEPGTRTVLYAPLTNHSHEIGQAYLEPNQPSWVYLSLSADVQSDVTLRCMITEPDGVGASLGTFNLDHGHGGWSIPTPIQRDGMIVATVIDGAGRVIGSAHFAPEIAQVSKPRDQTKSAASDPSHDRHSQHHDHDDPHKHHHHKHHHHNHHRHDHK
jgi:hypothetical protein